MSELIGKIIGGFRVLAEIKGGSGGQGQVFKAVCENPPFDGIKPGTAVALKVMNLTLYDDSTKVWAEMEKCTDELARLSHPNILKYYGCFSEQGTFCDIHAVVQEWLEGETLKQRLARNPHGLDADEALYVTDAALAGLEYVAANGILHRDVRPRNIFLCLDGGVKIIGFEDAHLEGDATTSALGNLVRPFDYMAPEFSNSTFCGDERSDVFSMGVVMHEVTTGHTPYQNIEGKSGRADFAFLSRWAKLHVDGTNPIHVNSRIRRILVHAEEVFTKSLAPNREERYSDFSTFRAGLKKIGFRELCNGDNTYRIIQFVGRGNQGEVFKARHLQSGNVVAVKRILRSGYKFASFFRMISGLTDSAIVRIIDCFKMGDEWFVVMDFLPGTPDRSLRDAIRMASRSPCGHLPIVDVLHAFKRYAQGLKVMHGNRVTHSSINPSSLYYNADSPDRSLIMDFSWPQEESDSAAIRLPLGSDYIPPEVFFTDNRGGPGMDVYALGLSFYEALSGKTAYPRLPLGNTGFVALINRAKNKEPPSFDSPIVTARPKLLQLLKDMTNIDPGQRIKDAAEVERRIGELLSEERQSKMGDSIVRDDDLPTLKLPDEPVSVFSPDERTGEQLKSKTWMDEIEERIPKRCMTAVVCFGAMLVGIASFVYGRDSICCRVLVDILAVVWLAMSCLCEMKTYLLPDRLTLGGVFLWLALGFAIGGTDGLLASGKAAGVGLLVILGFYLTGMAGKRIGGGLVKMVVACCAYVGWGRLLPFGVLCVVMGFIMVGSIWMERVTNGAMNRTGSLIPGSPVLAVATLSVIVLKWLGWIT